MTYLKKKKNFTSQKGHFSNFSTQKPKKIEMPQMPNYMKHCQLKKSLNPMPT